MSAIELFSQPAWARLALTLLHFLWQGLAVVAIVALAARLLKLRHGPPRYAAYLACMLVMAACPVVTFLVVEVPPATQLNNEVSILAGEQVVPANVDSHTA